MSGALQKVALVAGMVALAATGIGAVASLGAFGTLAAGTMSASTAAALATVATVGKIATVAAVAASVGSSLTATKPPAQGSSSSITIGANMPSPYLIGETYYGGNRVHLAGYGTQDDVPNAYLIAVDVFGVAGPYEALVATYADFTEITFDGSGNATGFYANHFARDYQLGATPEADALTAAYAGPPNWGPEFKLSGKPAILWNARFPKSGKRFGSGFPQTGAVWKGVKLYDPRLDSTYPGGSGPHRWAPPTDIAGHSAAKATWTYSRNPGLHALRYALGSWERDETKPADPYQKVFGVGLDWDGVAVADMVELANVCDDNGWTCNGVLYEPGDKWANLKSILQAGGAEPCFRSGALGLRINAPRVSLDTITIDDLADGELSFPAMRSFRDRVNTKIPKYRSPDHKWEYVSSAPVQVLEYVTEDGGEKAAEVQYNLVTNPDQAAQLAALELVDARSSDAIELVCKPRLRRYVPGDMLTLGDLGAGPQFDGADCIIIKRSVDPATMKVALTLVTERPGKYEYALGRTGTSPPAITIAPPEDADGIAGDDGDIVYDGQVPV